MSTNDTGKVYDFPGMTPASVAQRIQRILAADSLAGPFSTEISYIPSNFFSAPESDEIRGAPVIPAVSAQSIARPMPLIPKWPDPKMADKIEQQVNGGAAQAPSDVPAPQPVPTTSPQPSVVPPTQPAATDPIPPPQPAVVLPHSTNGDTPADVLAQLGLGAPISGGQSVPTPPGGIDDVTTALEHGTPAPGEQLPLPSGSAIAVTASGELALRPNTQPIDPGVATPSQDISQAIAAIQAAPLPVAGETQVLPGGVERINDTTVSEDGRFTTRTITTKVPGLDPIIDTVRHENIDPAAGLLPVNSADWPQLGKPAKNRDPFTGYQWEGLGDQTYLPSSGLSYQRWDLKDEKNDVVMRVYVTLSQGKVIETEATRMWPEKDGWTSQTGPREMIGPFVKGTTYKNGIPLEYYGYDEHANKIPRDPNYVDPGNVNVDLVAEGILISALPIPYGGITKMVFRAGELVVDGIADGVRIIKGTTSAADPAAGIALGAEHGAEITPGIGNAVQPIPDHVATSPGAGIPAQPPVVSAQLDAKIALQGDETAPRGAADMISNSRNQNPLEISVASNPANARPSRGWGRVFPPKSRRPTFDNDTYQPSPAERIMSNRKIVGVPTPLDQGGSAYLVTLDNGLQGVYKPVSNEVFARMKIPMPLAYNEVAAARLDELLEFGLVPPTGLGTGPAGKGSIQLFVDFGSRRPFLLFSQDEQERMAVLDYIIGNSDRHGKNYMPDLDGNLIAFDHGNSFPWAPVPEFGIRSDFVYYNLGDQLSPSVLEKVRALNPNRVRSALEAASLNTESINGVLARLEEIQSDGMITGKSYSGMINPEAIPARPALRETTTGKELNSQLPASILHNAVPRLPLLTHGDNNTKASK